MKLEEFQKSLSKPEPPDNLSGYLQSLWYDAKGDWHKAHKIIQEIEDWNAAWIHAYLHRKEGDTGNAGYWYAKAGRNRPGNSLEEEWSDIVKTLLK